MLAACTNFAFTYVERLFSGFFLSCGRACLYKSIDIDNDMLCHRETIICVPFLRMCPKCQTNHLNRQCLTRFDGHKMQCNGRKTSKLLFVFVYKHQIYGFNSIKYTLFMQRKLAISNVKKQLWSARTPPAQKKRVLFFFGKTHVFDALHSTRWSCYQFTMISIFWMLIGINYYAPNTISVYSWIDSRKTYM